MKQLMFSVWGVCPCIGSLVGVAIFGASGVPQRWLVVPGLVFICLEMWAQYRLGNAR